MDIESTSHCRHLRRTPLAACLGMALVFAAGHAVGVTPVAPLPLSFHPLHGLVHGAIARARRANHPRASRIPDAGLRGRAASTAAVTSCADDGSSGTLRAVVASAVDGDVIDMTNLACSTITLTNGEISIDVDHLTLQGPGQATLAIDGNHASRVLVANGGGGNSMTLTLNDLTIANGFESGDASGYALGGCIYSPVISPLNTIAMNHATVTGCTVGDEAATALSVGGGVFTYGSLTVNASTLSANRATAPDGVQIVSGAAYAYFRIAVADSTVTGNSATRLTPGSNAFALGGAFFVSAISSEFLLTGSSISNNSSDDFGGALFLSPYSTDGTEVTLSIANSTFSGNTSGRTSAIQLLTHIGTPFTLTVHNSTVTGNVATSPLGGCALRLAGYVPATVDISSSIVTGNAGAAAPYDICSHFSTSTLTGTHNLIGASELPTPPDTISADPLLGPLQDNGGPTWTHALLAGSPAIDAGSNPGGLDFDQRGIGYPRVAGASADIGAFEMPSADDSVFTDGFDG